MIDMFIYVNYSLKRQIIPIRQIQYTCTTIYESEQKNKDIVQGASFEWINSSGLSYHSDLYIPDLEFVKYE
jgi:hypothetical protein